MMIAMSSRGRAGAVKSALPTNFAVRTKLYGGLAVKSTRTAPCERQLELEQSQRHTTVNGSAVAGKERLLPGSLRRGFSRDHLA